jgi:hypothetical protein
MAGYGRIFHPDDRFEEPHRRRRLESCSRRPLTVPVGFQGNNGHYVDYVAFTIGMRFGALN